MKMVFPPRFALGIRPSQSRVILLHYRNMKWRMIDDLHANPFEVASFSKRARRLGRLIIQSAAGRICTRIFHVRTVTLDLLGYVGEEWSRTPVMRRAGRAYDA